jgi:hypothetical protein
LPEFMVSPYGWSVNLSRLEKLTSLTPSLRSRIIVSFICAAWGATLIHTQYVDHASHTDFGMVWYGARAVINRVDPYALIGPGREFNYPWPLIYPVPALLVVAPLSPLSESVAATIFIALSSGLLAFGITRDGWYRLPIFVTEAFAASARLGQWSIILTAALFLPFLGAIAIAKPQAALPILAGAKSSKTVSAGIAGALVLVFVSTVLQPDWIGEWLRGITSAKHMEPPVIRFGGLMILLVLLRWRRPEAWLIATLACLPQSWGWYGTLAVFTIPASFAEAVVLAGVATVGVYVGSLILPDVQIPNDLFAWVGSLIVFTVYLPAVVLVLRRPNEGPLPAWLVTASNVRIRWRLRGGK